MLSALAAVALAQPANHHHRRGHGHAAAHANFDKRALYTEWIVETETITKTLYKDAHTTYIVGEQETAASEPEEAAAEPTNDAEFYEPPASTKKEEAAPKPTPAPAAPKPETPKPEESKPAAPKPEAPKPETPKPEEPETPEYEAPSSGGGHDGVLTYYDLGMGACGFDDSGADMSEYIVALSHVTMGEQSNGNPLCDKKVNVSANGKTITATVRDKCMGCKAGEIDGSRKVIMELFGTTDGGRVPVTWDFA